MAKGIYYYKLVSTYPEDVTKNCKLTINEIDSNFLSLKDEDIKSATLVRDEKTLVLTRNNGETLVVDLGSVTYDLDVKTDNCSEGGASITISYDGVDGPKTVVFGNLVTVDYLNDLIDGKILKKVITDGTLRGNGTIDSPLGLSKTEKTGMYAPVKSKIDLTAGGKLPHVAKLGTRYITVEYVNDYGYLYNGKGLDKISHKLEHDKRGWRVPTKNDWDALLNSIEPCDFRNHGESRCHVELGKVAGKYLKSECGWIGQEDCACTATKPTTGCSMDDEAEEYFKEEYVSGANAITPELRKVSPYGVDKYGMGILPAGMVHLDVYDKPLAEGFKAQAFFWTSTHLNGDVEQDRYVKEFSHKASGVIQEAICPNPFYSVRLVKDYDGKNYFDSEYIDGVLYKTILFPESGQIWLATNYASQEGFNHVNSGIEHGDIADVNNGEVLEKRKALFLNEWNGRYWEKKMLNEGDTVVVENPCFDNVEPKEFKYCWKTVSNVGSDEPVGEDEVLGGDVEVLDEKECDTITIEREAQYNLEYRVYTTDGCDQDLVNTDDLIVERVINLVIPVLVKEKEDRLESEAEIKKDIEDLEGKLDSVTEELEQKIEDLDKKIDDETERAKDAEQKLQDAIDEESNRAQEAEKELDAKIEAESNRAKYEEERIERELTEKINAETERAISEETRIEAKLDEEIERAKSAEKELDEKIEAETERAIEAEEALDDKIEAEIKRATEREDEIEEELLEEIDRAKDRENEIEGQLIDQTKNPYKLSASVEKGEYNMVLESKDGKDEHSIKIEFDGNFGEF